MKFDYTKSPRIYVTDALSEGGTLDLTKDHAHYLMTVLRKNAKTPVRVFNGKDGEFVGLLSPISKKHAQLTSLQKIKNQPKLTKDVHLYFAPVKKDRLQFLIEKAVELGATALHPVITERTENRKPNMDKISAYIIEASEQCERLSIPVLHDPCTLSACRFQAPTYAAIERDDSPIFTTLDKSLGILIGPEGGWGEEEKTSLTANPNIKTVSLGDTILRAETAALFMLARIAE